MHPFAEMIDRAVGSALLDIEQREGIQYSSLEQGGGSAFVRDVQAQNLRRVILAVGMFSIFEAHLQDTLKSDEGFLGVRQYLYSMKEVELAKKLETYVLAINVLKHGRGRSYNALLTMIDELPFQIKRPDEDFFCEGDVSEVASLIQVDNQFVYECVRLIEAVMSKVDQVDSCEDVDSPSTDKEE